MNDQYIKKKQTPQKCNHTNTGYKTFYWNMKSTSEQRKNKALELQVNANSSDHLFRENLKTWEMYPTAATRHKWESFNIKWTNEQSKDGTNGIKNVGRIKHTDKQGINNPIDRERTSSQHIKPQNLTQRLNLVR